MRTKMMPERFYQGLDKGIRFAVRILHAAGIETCQSCQGGEGHAYDWPSVDLVPQGASDAAGFAAIAALTSYGLVPRSLAIIWALDACGHPYERIWRIEFDNPSPERADQKPAFVYGYVAR